MKTALFGEKKYLIWGTGRLARLNLNMLETAKADDLVIAFIDSDEKKWGVEVFGRNVFSPNKIKDIKYDYIDIWVKSEYELIKKRLINEYNVPEDKIKSIFGGVKEYLLNKYVEDAEAMSFLKNFCSHNRIESFGFNRENVERRYEVFFDEDAKMNYIFFENKRMYLAKTFSRYQILDGKKYVNDVWFEQDQNSPHLYEDGSVMVSENDVLVDAGVCEGNFSLHHIDKVKKIYLIECDEEWMEALRHTFSPYSDKVVFCNKFLCEESSDESISIDELVEESIDFLKMDIEGGEVNALKGAKETLSINHEIKCSICSYHNHGDESKISMLLDKYGFTTSFSKGYMFYPSDDIWVEPELRRGLVRGYKKRI